MHIPRRRCEKRVQDALNAVYKIQDTRSYLKAHIYAIGLTIILSS
jgi:uncharacterized BrkB/YihY/UPF0761 family membrane protein